MKCDLCGVFLGQGHLDEEDISGSEEHFREGEHFNWSSNFVMGISSTGSGDRAGAVSCCPVVTCWPDRHQFRMQKMSFEVSIDRCDLRWLSLS